jgi:hypothetical protein
MDSLPKKGDSVTFDDRWFYRGTGTVVDIQEKPHHAVLVKVETIEDKGAPQKWVGKETWILAPNVKKVE